MNFISSLMLEKLVITQKTYGAENSLSAMNKLVFVTCNSVSKFALFALFELLSFEVLKINSMNYKSEKIMFRSRKGNTKSYKKFIVTFSSSVDIAKIIDDISSLNLVAVNSEV